ncbi:hypothetical protein PACTADRAFT_48693 [Pachysolen tannophilus NRRL Y-2460]|uniref:Uncharacterized protein n=1 Tax=Pachysolen tannophilus NRRL Y-2460 TaxID=669874 RepID=A0A1E4TYS2_PACTA|nr:hypothetical protein PACTADRAFT_48693 [Pachysolen tannophilus NRRL Y-2460]
MALHNYLYYKHTDKLVTKIARPHDSKLTSKVFSDEESNQQQNNNNNNNNNIDEYEGELQHRNVSHFKKRGSPKVSAIKSNGILTERNKEAPISAVNKTKDSKKIEQNFAKDDTELTERLSNVQLCR